MQLYCTSLATHISDSNSADTFLTSDLEEPLTVGDDFNILQYATEESGIKLESNINFEHIVDEVIIVVLDKWCHEPCFFELSCCGAFPKAPLYYYLQSCATSLTDKVEWNCCSICLLPVKFFKRFCFVCRQMCTSEFLNW